MTTRIIDKPASFVIEAGIAIPPKMANKKSNPDSLMGTTRRLAVGESFFAPLRDGRSIQYHVSILSATGRTVSRRHGGKFTTRSVVENDIPGVRIWRVE